MTSRRHKSSSSRRSQSPCVMLGPLQTGGPQQTFSCIPPISALFNKAENSDIKLIVNGNTFYAHRLVLSAASEVFSKMLSSKFSWVESSIDELTLQEEEDCSKVFESFLYYMYSGSIAISEQHAIPLFMLCDKYNVKPLYEECVKIIVKGLKVYTVSDSTSRPTDSKHLKMKRRRIKHDSNSDSEASSNEIETDHVEYGSSAEEESDNNEILVLHQIGSEAFPISLVIKMLAFCHNEVIASAAFNNLQARLKNQVQSDNYSVWNELPLDILMQMLADDNFFCDEYKLFQAAKSWLNFKSSRVTTNSIVKDVLSLIRYATLTTEQLYNIDRDEMIKICPDVQEQVTIAIKYKLFSRVSRHEHWEGDMFIPRKPRQQNIA